MIATHINYCRTDDNGKKVIYCEIYSKNEPSSLPTSGADIDNLTSEFVFEVGTPLIVVSTKTAYVYCGTTDGFVKVGG